MLFFAVEKIQYKYMLYSYVDLNKQFILFFILIFVLFLFLWNIDKEKLKRQCMWMNGPANVFPRSAELAILTMGMAAIIYQERPTNKQRWFHNGIILVVIELFMAVFFGFFRHLIGCDRGNFYFVYPFIIINIFEYVMNKLISSQSSVSILDNQIV